MELVMSASLDHLQDVILSTVADEGSVNNAAAKLGCSRKTAQKYNKLALAAGKTGIEGELEFPRLDSPDIPIDELIRRREQDFARASRAKSQRRLITVKVKIDGPIGLGAFGDPHTDDNGTDLGLLLRHADIVRETEGLYGINVGDNQNLWPGRLARLYANQNMMASEGWRVTEHFLKRTRDWLCLMKGNHDHWQGDGDPLDWIMRDLHTYVADYDIRLELKFPNGRSFRIWLRHDFAGNSMWNNIHGLVRAAKMGANYNLFLAGHKHSSAHHAEYNAETSIVWHALRTAGYKMHDDYAEVLGFQESNVWQCPVIIIDPAAKNPSQFCTVIYDTEEGADFLTFKRKRAGK